MIKTKKTTKKQQKTTKTKIKLVFVFQIHELSYILMLCIKGSITI